MPIFAPTLMKLAALYLLLALPAPLAAEPRHDIVVLAERERPHLVRFTATLEPLRQADLALEVGGQIAARRVAPGQRVTRDQVLIELDPARFKIQLRLRRAELQGAQSQFDLAARSLARAEALYADSSLSTEAVDQARHQAASARSRRDMAHAALALARRDLRGTTIRAPFAGEVAAVHVEIGEQVAPGQVALRLASRDTVALRAELAAAEIAKLDTGLRADIAPADRRPAFAATLTRLTRIADPVSRRYPVELWAADPGGPLGTLAAVAVAGRDQVRGVEVPSAALRFRADRAFAYVVAGTGPSGRLEEREVIVASEWPGGLLLVSAGLAPGERIIARAAAALVPGQTVAVGRTVGPAAP